MTGLDAFDSGAIARPRAVARPSVARHRIARSGPPSHPTGSAALAQMLSHVLARARGDEALRRCMLAMLAGWIWFALVLDLSVHSLNRVTVPVLGLRLGFFLVLQGTLVLFVVALRLFVRCSPAAATARRKA